MTRNRYYLPTGMHVCVSNEIDGPSVPFSRSIIIFRVEFFEYQLRRRFIVAFVVVVAVVVVSCE